MTDKATPKQLGSPFAGPSSKPWLVPRPGGIISLVALTTTVFFRAGFGQRCINPRLLPKAALCFAAFMVLMRFYAGGGSFTLTAPVPVQTMLAWSAFVTLFFIYTGLSLRAAYRRKEMIDQEYSLSDGVPHPILMTLLPFVRDEWDFEKYYEPAICVGVAAALLYFHNWFGVYLLAGGLSAHHVAKQKQSGRVNSDMDVLDSRVNASTQPRFSPKKPEAESERTIRVR